MTEQQIQKSILNYLKTKGWAVKVIACNRNGTPDIIACIDGRFIAIEVKRPSGVLSKLQQKQLELISEQGGEAFAAYSLEDVKRRI